MSDKGNDHRGGYTKWIVIIFGIFVCASPLLGILIDVFVLFPSSDDAHGHGVPVFTILLPLIAVFLAVVAAIAIGVSNLIMKASARGLQGRTHYEYQKYEYLKILQKCDSAQSPAMILHEIDADAGRCSVRCIYIYQNGYVENFVNRGVYAPVSTVQSIQASDVLQCQTAYVITKGEFENVWNSGHYTQH